MITRGHTPRIWASRVPLLHRRCLSSPSRRRPGPVRPRREALAARPTACAGRREGFPGPLADNPVVPASEGRPGRGEAAGRLSGGRGGGARTWCRGERGAGGVSPLRCACPPTGKMTMSGVAIEALDFLGRHDGQISCSKKKSLRAGRSGGRGQGPSARSRAGHLKGALRSRPCLPRLDGRLVLRGCRVAILKHSTPRTGCPSGSSSGRLSSRTMPRGSAALHLTCAPALNRADVRAPGPPRPRVAGPQFRVERTCTKGSRRKGSSSRTSASGSLPADLRVEEEQQAVLAGGLDVGGDPCASSGSLEQSSSRVGRFPKFCATPGTDLRSG